SATRGPAPSGVNSTHEPGVGPWLQTLSSSSLSRSRRARALVMSNSSASLARMPMWRGAPASVSTRWRRARRGGPGVQGSAGRALAGGAVGGVGLEEGALGIGQVAEPQLGDALVDVPAHDWAPSMPTRSWASAAATRDLTVPMGARTRSAISDDDSLR